MEQGLAWLVLHREGNQVVVLAIEGAIKTPSLHVGKSLRNSRYPDQGHAATGSRNRIPAEGGVQRFNQLFNIWTALQRYRLALASSSGDNMMNDNSVL
jgi:hypothetical protein